MLVVLETEIWPNWFMQARKMGIKIALINGRISVRSIKGYLKLVPIIKDTLNCVDAFSMIHEADARRIVTMGALPDRVEVNGNAKFDWLLKQTDPSLKQKMEALYRLQGDETVFIAGSTRRGEEEAILDVYEEMAASFPKSVLIIAPRHIKRANHIADLVKRRGLSCQFRTELNQTDGVRVAPVVIIDTIGELQATYSIATLVFCGGSLVPKGGQNAFEAAVWGKPVLYGPSMEDFLDIKVALEKTGGSILVQNRTELAKQVMYLLNHPEKAREMGKSARRTVTRHKGAADKHAAVILRLLNQK
jgi:3-deoxy-D-manno-octulosonic-acid transferase